MRKTELAVLNHALEMEHCGGFYTADRSQYLRLERLRAKGWLKFWDGRRSRFWAAQFYTITDAGRTARVEAKRWKQP